MNNNSAEKEAFIQKLTGIVLANIRDEGFGVEKLSIEAGTSRFTLNRKLKAATGQDASRFIRFVRLQQSLDLLGNSDLTIAEIAFMVGFGSPAYFTKCFHDQYGYPPGKLRSGETGHGEYGNTIASSQLKLFLKGIKKSYIIAFSAIITLSFAAFLVFSRFSRNGINSETPAGDAMGTTVAVLPFLNLGENMSDSYVYDGVMEEVYNSLSKVRNLTVVSRSSMELFTGSELTPEEIGRLNKIDYLVEGSGQKAGGIYRIRVHLVDAGTGTNIWSETYQQKIISPRRLFRLQSRIARGIASALDARLSAEEIDLITRVPTINSTAWNLYKEGNILRQEYQKSRDPETYNKAVNLYSSALEKDSTFSRAYSAIAGLYILKNAATEYFSEKYLDSARRLLYKSLNFDDKLDEAWYLMGEYCRLNGRSEEAIINYDKALKINPNYLEACLQKWYVLNWIYDDFVKSLENGYKGLSLIRGKERAAILKTLARTWLDAGFTEMAEKYYNSALSIDSNKISYIASISWIEWCKGNFEGAVRIRQRELDLNPNASFLAYYCTISDRDDEAYFHALRLIKKSKDGLLLQGSHRVGYALLKAGRTQEAEIYFRQQIKFSEESIRLGRDIEQRKAAHYDLAAVWSFYDDKEKALYYLNEISKKNAFALWWLTFLRHDILMDNIREDDRYKEIQLIVESKHNAEHERVRIWLENQKDHLPVY